MKTKIKAIILLTAVVTVLCGSLLRYLYTQSEDIRTQDTEISAILSADPTATELIPHVEIPAYVPSTKKRSNDTDNPILPELTETTNKIVTAQRNYNNQESPRLLQANYTGNGSSLKEHRSGGHGKNTLFPQAGRSSSNYASAESYNTVVQHQTAYIPGPMFDNGTSDPNDTSDDDFAPPPEGGPVGEGMVVLMLLALGYLAIKRNLNIK